jgi:hypothetical protein
MRAAEQMLPIDLLTNWLAIDGSHLFPWRTSLWLRLNELGRCRNCLFGPRQKSRCAIRIGEGGAENLIPSANVFRLITERQNRLRGGSTRHADSYCLCLRAKRTNRRFGPSRLSRCDVCDQARRSAAATPACGQLDQSSPCDRSRRPLCFHCASVIQAEVLGAVHRVNRDFTEADAGAKDFTLTGFGRGQGFTKYANIL